METSMPQIVQQNNAPVKAAFICLVLAWAMAILPIPFISMGGMIVFNIIAFILAIICMTRNAVKSGGLVLAGVIIGTPIMYFMGYALIGLLGASALFGASTLSGHAKEINQVQASSSFSSPSNQAEIFHNGKWEGKFIYPKGAEAPFTMNIKVSSNSVSGDISETDPKTNKPVNSTISGSINNNRQIHFTQNFGAQHPKVKCNARYDATSKSMAGKCSAAGQSANFTAHLL